MIHTGGPNPYHSSRTSKSLTRSAVAGNTMPQFYVDLAPAPWKVGNASHFVNVEKRLRDQVTFIRDLKKKGVLEAGPWAILNRVAPSPSFVANADSWEQLSRMLHEDPMLPYQGPNIHYLADWEEAMAKHAETTGSDEGIRRLQEDIRVDLGLDLPRQREPLESIVYQQANEIKLLRAEIGTLLAEGSKDAPHSSPKRKR